VFRIHDQMTFEQIFMKKLFLLSQLLLFVLLILIQ